MATNKAGLLAPWAYVRRTVAERWRCRPWEVDDAPLDELLLELKIMRMEAEAAQRNRPAGGPAGAPG